MKSTDGAENRAVQQRVCSVSREPDCTLQRLQIGLDQRKAIGIPIIDPELCLSRVAAHGLQAPAQGPDPATGHQIKPAEGTRCA